MEEVIANARNNPKDPSKFLIKVIKEHPIIYSRDHELYKNREAREKAWVDICNIMEPNYETLNKQERNKLAILYTKKWYNIRDSYRRSFSMKNRHRPYIYKDALSFMDNNYKNPIHTEDNNPIHTEDNNDTDEEEAEPTCSEVFLDTNHIDDKDLDVEIEAKRLKLDEVVKKEMSNNLQNDIVTVLSNIINKADDEEASFFRCITSSVKSLSTESKLEFKIEVLKLIKKLKAKDNDEFTMNTEYLETSD